MIGEQVLFVLALACLAAHFELRKR